MKKLCTSSALAPEKCLQTRSSLGGLKISLSIFFVLCSLFVVNRARAADVSLVVSPPITDIQGKPGETVQKTIKVTNNGTEDLILEASTADFIVEDDIGTPIKVSVTASGRYLASPWFTLEKSEIVLPPKGTDQIVVLITIPSDALPGGHYAGVFFEPVPARGMKTTVSYTAAEVGSLFEITIAGNIKYDATIKDFSVKTPLAEFGPVNFSATIENQSDTHITPHASIAISDMLGRKLTDLKLDDTNIFPFTSRTVKGTWQTVWGLGRYTATLTAAYGPGLVATRTLFFWIIPYRILAAILVILLTIIGLWIVIRRHLKHREDHRDDEIDELKRKIIELENNKP